MEITATEIQTIIQKAHNAQKAWASVSWHERVKRLHPIKAALFQNGNVLAELISRENGKPVTDALATEILPVTMAFSYYCKQGKKWIAPEKIHNSSLFTANKRSYYVYKPYGVIGIISPWNYPFAIPFSEILMALLAGNGVVVKVASSTPEIGKALAELFTMADLPPDLFNYVTIPGSKAGKAFIEGGVDKLFFTGSTAVGKELMSLAASRLLPLVLELGGADAAIVRADADLDRAAAGIAWAGFSNAGQACGGVQRILVHQSVYEAFLKKLSDRVHCLRIGPAFTDASCTEVNWDVDIGPVHTKKQKQLLQNQVKTCLSMGAKIAAQSSAGSIDGDDLLFPALVLVNVTADMPIMKEEVFGPVVAVIPVKDDEEALAIANSSSYGLTGSVWSRNHKEARYVAERIRAGAVMINDHLMSHGLAETPWGGYGDSGLGRTHGKPGFREMVYAQVIINEILPGVSKDLWWYPYSKAVYQGLYSIVRLISGNSIASKIKYIPGFLKIFFRFWEKDKE